MRLSNSKWLFYHPEISAGEWRSDQLARWYWSNPCWCITAIILFVYDSIDQGWSCVYAALFGIFGHFWSTCEVLLNSLFIWIITSVAHSQFSASRCTLWAERVLLLLLWEIPPQGLITTRQIVSAPQNRTDSEWMEQTGLFSPYIITKWWLCMWEVALNRKITTPTITLSAQLSGLSQSRGDLEQQSSLLHCIWNGRKFSPLPPFPVVVFKRSSALGWIALQWHHPCLKKIQRLHEWRCEEDNTPVSFSEPYVGYIPASRSAELNAL